MTHYHVGDIPAEGVVIEPARGEEPINLDLFTSVEVTLIDPAGQVVSSTELAGSITEAGVFIEWGTEPLLELEGLYAIRLTLENPAGASERLSPVFVVVEDSSGWFTIDQAHEEWRDARSIGDVKLWRLLEIARMQVLDYAPVLTSGARPPQHYIEAQLMQARNTWNAGRVAPSGEVGGDDFAITPHPLDWQIKQLLRPRRGAPVVG